MLVDTGYWQDMLAWIRDELISNGMISPDDVQLLHATDEPADAVRFVLECYDRACAENPAKEFKQDVE